ncbi:hypothetical protein BpHYR1_027720 [Brachionus plicatilis]|uniref:Uncharacterized protein n=1 Tax=Brachionus plicatilis TaxID=10195 RepID=A0A3M7SKV3_BRAPC|nr:hypothetical protein BpHYR1_027720 [Brachionus plicatilis]
MDIRFLKLKENTKISKIFKNNSDITKLRNWYNFRNRLFCEIQDKRTEQYDKKFTNFFLESKNWFCSKFIKNNSTVYMFHKIQFLYFRCLSIPKISFLSILHPLVLKISYIIKSLFLKLYCLGTFDFNNCHSRIRSNT